MDSNFYTSFYPDLADLNKNDTIAVNEHYISVGKLQGRVANKSELNTLLETILHFDSKTFTSANLCPDYVNNLAMNGSVVKKMDSNNNQWINYFYDETNGDLYKSQKFRVKNSNDIKLHNEKWEHVYDEIFKTINFNLEFYKSFYSIPPEIINTRQLRIQWLKNGLFNKQYPNMQYLNNDENMITIVQTVLMSKFGLDVSYLALMKREMSEYSRKHRINVPRELTDENSILLFLFFNTAKQLRLFFNSGEYSQYVEKNKLAYDNAVQAVKSLAHVSAIEASNKEYLSQELRFLKSKSLPFAGLPILKDPFSQIISVFNIIKLTNNVYIDCFKKIQQTEDMTLLIGKIVSHEITNYIDPILNSMEIKLFVVSLVYNLFIDNKVDKTVYLDFVKAKSIEILKKLFTEGNIQDFDVVLEQDVDYIITNKQIIKMSYFKYLVVRFLSGAFLRLFG